jgi:hypothetical protein
VSGGVVIGKTGQKIRGGLLDQNIELRVLFKDAVHIDSPSHALQNESPVTSSNLKVKYPQHCTAQAFTLSLRTVNWSIDSRQTA